jgi:hypothetical protein
LLVEKRNAEHRCWADRDEMVMQVLRRARVRDGAASDPGKVVADGALECMGKWENRQEFVVASWRDDRG